MVMTTWAEYFNEKKSLLNQLLNLSETLVGQAQEFDLFVVTLEKREGLIQQLVALDNQYKARFNFLLGPAQVNELNRLVELVTSLDSHANALLTQEQSKVTEAIKNNIQEQKLFQYNGDELIQILTDSIFTQFMLNSSHEERSSQPSHLWVHSRCSHHISP